MDIELGNMVTIRVQAETRGNEVLYVCGSTKEMGEWNPDQAMHLSLEDGQQSVWRGEINVQETVEFRYFVGTILHSDLGDGKHVVIKRWEANTCPRKIVRNDYEEELHQFGYYYGQINIEPGFLTLDTVVQLKFQAKAINLWGNKSSRRKISYLVNAFDMPPSDSTTSPDNSCDGFDIVEDNKENSYPSRRSCCSSVEISTLNGIEWEFKKQEEFGRIYDSKEFNIFQAYTTNYNQTGFTVKIFINDTLNGSQPKIYGVASVLPSTFQDTFGQVVVPVFDSNHHPIGEIKVGYVIVRPLQNYTFDLRVGYSQQLKQKVVNGVRVGHRGSGKARRIDVVENVLENTVASFKYATKHGADMVELDVQLTKDKVPIIYHDFMINTVMKKKHVMDMEPMHIAIKDLTFSQLQLLKCSPVVPASHQPYDFLDEDSMDNQPFPSLRQVLETAEIKGVNIEIKFPIMQLDGTWHEIDRVIEMNEYLDIILKTVLEYGGDKPIVYSSFHPDVCTMVRLKQNRYPILFLTQGQTDKWPPYFDLRTSTLPMAVYFAQSSSLLGICAHAEDLLRDKNYVSFAKERRLVLYCWGEDLNSAQVIEEVKKDGVDGIIYDKVDEFSKNQVFVAEAKSVQISLLDIVMHNNNDLHNNPVESTSGISSHTQIASTA